MDKSTDKSGECVTKLSACALATATAVVSGLFVLLLGLLASFTHHGGPWVNMLSSVYVGYSATPKGVFFGVIWALVDGYITGFILAWVYNAVVKYCNCKRCKPKEA